MILQATMSNNTQAIAQKDERAIAQDAIVTKLHILNISLFVVSVLLGLISLH